MTKDKTVILYSGGLDSFLMAAIAKENKIPYECVAIDIGQGYNAREQKAIEDSPFRVGHFSIPFMNGTTGVVNPKSKHLGDMFVPGRNLMLISVAGIACYPAKEVWLGTVANELNVGAVDKNDDFVEMMNEMFHQVMHPFMEYPTRLHYPLRDLNKVSEVKLLLDLGYSIHDLHSTVSCLKSKSIEDGNCGECPSCLRRWGSFGLLGVSEEYQVDPITSKAMIKLIWETWRAYRQHRSNMSTNYSEYDVTNIRSNHPTTSRTMEIFPYFMKVMLGEDILNPDKIWHDEKGMPIISMRISDELFHKTTDLLSDMIREMGVEL